MIGTGWFLYIVRDVHAAGVYILGAYVTWKERYSAFYFGGGQDI